MVTTLVSWSTSSSTTSSSSPPPSGDGGDVNKNLCYATRNLEKVDVLPSRGLCFALYTFYFTLLLLVNIHKLFAPTFYVIINYSTTNFYICKPTKLLLLFLINLFDNGSHIFFFENSDQLFLCSSFSFCFLPFEHHLIKLFFDVRTMLFVNSIEFRLR